MTTTISSKGQVTVPRKLRDVLGLTPGTKLEFELGEGGTLVCRKAAAVSFFSKFQGVGKTPNLPYKSGAEAIKMLRGPVGKGDVD